MLSPIRPQQWHAKNYQSPIQCSHKKVPISPCEPVANVKKRKISFKVKNSQPRKTQTVFSANKVAQLAQKFNELRSENAAQAANTSPASGTNCTTRKPTLKPKPLTNKLLDLKNRQLVKRKLSIKKSGGSDTNTKTSISVRKTIEIFERRNSEIFQTILNKKTNDLTEKEIPTNSVVEISKKSMKNLYYERLKIPKTTISSQVLKLAISEEKLSCIPECSSLNDDLKPNTSFLWRNKSKDSLNLNIYATIDYEDPIDSNLGTFNVVINQDETVDGIYDTVGPPKQGQIHEILAKTDEILKDYKSPKILTLLPPKDEDTTSIHSYESFYNDYEYVDENSDDIYETLSIKNIPKETEIVNSYDDEIYSTIHNYETVVNCLQTANTSIVNRFYDYNNCQSTDQSITKHCSIASSHSSGDSRLSVVSCDQASNSLYGRFGNGSEISSSDLSDDWVDLSDPEFSDCKENGFVVIREKQKSKKNSNWSHKVRHQFSKCPQNLGVSEANDEINDSYHYYESLQSDEDDFDSFDSESDEEIAQNVNNQNDSGVDMGNNQLPDPPSGSTTTNSNNQIYGLTRLAASANKHMKRLRRNWSLTKNDISKSLSRMTKKTRTPNENLTNFEPIKTREGLPPPLPATPPPLVPHRGLKPSRPVPPIPTSVPESVIAPQTVITAQNSVYQNVELKTNVEGAVLSPASAVLSPKTGQNTLGRKKNWLKFRRTISLSEQIYDDLPSAQNIPKSTFYLSDVGQPEGELPAVPITPNRSSTAINSLENAAPPLVPNRRRPQSIPPRPLSPPPPAPVNLDPKKTPNIKKDQKLRSTSWYAECGVFKQGPLATVAEPPSADVILPPLPIPPTKQKTSSTCWYAEVGLYENTEKLNNLKNINLTENSYYNGGETELTDPLKKYQSGDMQLLLKDEPLYQFYDAAITEHECRETSSDSEYDGYEEICAQKSENSEQISSETDFDKQLKISPVRTRLLGPGGAALPGRTLWCEIPEVIQSEILCTLTISQKKLQEAKFEIITSEASYLNSLTVLEEHFIDSLDKEGLIDPIDRETLFGNVKKVKQCSERLLADLEISWQDSILLPDICKIIYQHCVEHFHVYIEYCSNQLHSDVILRRYRGDTPSPISLNYSGGTYSAPQNPPNKSKTKFIEILKKLENSSVCQSLSLHSFLMLPMQRVTRWPLLMDAVLKRLAPNDSEFVDSQKSLRALNDIVSRCNEGAREAERTLEVQRIAQQLEYPCHMPKVDLQHPNRWLVKSGEVIQLLARGARASGEDGVVQMPKLTFGKRFAKVSIVLFLFEDVLIITKKKSEECYQVLHHCLRSFIEVSTSSADQTPAPFSLNISNSSDASTQTAQFIFLTLLENQDGRTVELMLSCNSETDRQRWLAALRPKSDSFSGETIYESWDCPQVRAVHQYQACQPDELALFRGDVVNIDRKMADGWYHGTKLRDDVSGWFPGNHTQEIANPHVRARNLRQRYRLLAFTDSYLNSNK